MCYKISYFNLSTIGVFQVNPTGEARSPDGESSGLKQVYTLLMGFRDSSAHLGLSKI